MIGQRRQLFSDARGPPPSLRRHFGDRSPAQPVDRHFGSHCEPALLARCVRQSPPDFQAPCSPPQQPAADPRRRVWQLTPVPPPWPVRAAVGCAAHHQRVHSARECLHETATVSPRDVRRIDRSAESLQFHYGALCRLAEPREPHRGLLCCGCRQRLAMSQLRLRVIQMSLADAAGPQMPWQSQTRRDDPTRSPEPRRSEHP